MNQVPETIKSKKESVTMRTAIAQGNKAQVTQMVEMMIIICFGNIIECLPRAAAFLMLDNCPYRLDACRRNLPLENSHLYLLYYISPNTHKHHILAVQSQFVIALDMLHRVHLKQ